MASQRHRTPSIAPQPVTQKSLQTSAQSKQYWRNQPQANWEDRPAWEVEEPEPYKPADPTFRGLSQEWKSAGMVIQPKLTIGAPKDKYEQEADRVAEQVVKELHSPNSELQANEITGETTIQREKSNNLQKKPAIGSIAGAIPATTELEAAIHQARSEGQPLPKHIRQPMEQAFGADFSRVRVHTDDQADRLNRSLQAKAFTTGQDMFFRQGVYQPGDHGGQELIAHELTHVIQQRGSDGKTVQRVVSPDLPIGTVVNVNPNGKEGWRHGRITEQWIETIEGENSISQRCMYRVVIQGRERMHDINNDSPHIKNAQYSGYRADDSVEEQHEPENGLYAEIEKILTNIEENKIRDKKYMYDIILEFGIQPDGIDSFIAAGSWNLAKKLKGEDLLFTENSRVQKPWEKRVETVRIIGTRTTKMRLEDTVDLATRKQVESIFTDMKEKQMLGRLYIRGHGDSEKQEVNGWTAYEVVNFLIKSGIRETNVKVVSITACQGALTPNELERRGAVDRPKEHRQELLKKYNQRATKVYDQPSQVQSPKTYDGKDKNTSFVSEFARSLMNVSRQELIVKGRTELLKVQDTGEKYTSYATGENLSKMSATEEGRRPYSKREFYRDPKTGKVHWRWTYT